MHKIFLVLLSVFSLSISSTNSKENLIQNLKEGGKIIFIRHATAPGGGDPDNFDINDCSTQRNLSEEGIEQSRRIGVFFYNNSITYTSIFQALIIYKCFYITIE